MACAVCSSPSLTLSGANDVTGSKQCRLAALCPGHWMTLACLSDTFSDSAIAYAGPAHNSYLFSSCGIEMDRLFKV